MILMGFYFLTKMHSADPKEPRFDDLTTKLKFAESRSSSTRMTPSRSSIPLYGHILTADQLDDVIEQRTKDVLSDANKLHSAVSLCHYKSDHDGVVIDSVTHSDIKAATPAITNASTNNTNSIVPYYHYPDLPASLKPCQHSTPRNFSISSTTSNNAQHKFSALPQLCSQQQQQQQVQQQQQQQHQHHHHHAHHTLGTVTDATSLVNKCNHLHILVKLSVDLIKTYKTINEVYYRKKRRLLEQGHDENNLKRDRKQSILNTDAGTNVVGAAATSGANDSSLSLVVATGLSANNVPVTNFGSCADSQIATGTKVGLVHYQQKTTTNSDHFVRPGEIWRNQYCIDKLIGTGSFGEVVRAKDLISGDVVAIKIIKNKRNFVEQARVEISLLREMGKYQETDEMAQRWGANYVVKLLGHFLHCGRLCLVFELLTYSLYELLRNTGFRGVSLNLTRKFGQQLCQALIFLSRPSIRIIHCDLKPENVLLVHPRRSAIKVVDFGSSCHADCRIYYYIQSRFYRSPEIIMSLEYSHAIDMWSLGCIMAELHSGQPLFIGQNEHEQMLKIVEVLGMPPIWMIEQGKKGLRYFEKTTDKKGIMYRPRLYREKDGKKIQFQNISSRNLANIIGVNTGGPQGRRLNEPGHTKADYARFLDVIQQMLTFDPAHRIRPDEALQHPFFTVRSSASAATTTTTATATAATSNIQPISSIHHNPVSAVTLVTTTSTTVTTAAVSSIVTDNGGDNIPAADNSQETVTKESILRPASNTNQETSTDSTNCYDDLAMVRLQPQTQSQPQQQHTDDSDGYASLASVVTIGAGESSK